MGLSKKEKTPSVKILNVENPKKQNLSKPKINKLTENKMDKSNPAKNKPMANKPKTPMDNKPKQSNLPNTNKPKPNEDNKPKQNIPPKKNKPNPNEANKPKQNNQNNPTQDNKSKDSKSNNEKQKNKPKETPKPKTQNNAKNQVNPIYAACRRLANNSQVQSSTLNMLKDLVNNIGKDKSQDQEHLKELEKLKSEFERLKIGYANQNAKILEDKDNELKNTCRKNDTLVREVMNLRKKVSQHQQSGKVSVELQKENEEMTKTIAKLEEERKSILALKEQKEGEIADIKKEFEHQKKDMNDLIKLVPKLAGNMSGEGTSSRTELSEEELISKMMALWEKASIQSESSKGAMTNKSDLNQGGDNSSPNPFPNMSDPSNQPFSHPNMYQHIPNMGQSFPNIGHPFSNMGPSLPNMGLHHTNMGLSQPIMGTPNAYMGNQYPNMGMQFPNMGHYPNMSHHFPNMSSQYPNMGSPFPNMAQQYPNMNPQMGHLSNFGQQIPINNQPQTANLPQTTGVPPTTSVPQTQDVAAKTNDSNMADQMKPPTPTGIDSTTSSVNLMTSTSPSEKPIIKMNIVEKANDFGDKKKKESNKNNEKSEKPCNVNPGKSAATGGKNKSGPSKDLWSQLEELKDKMKKTESSKKELCDEVSTILTDATKSTITSKEHFMLELSDCLKQINEIPNDGGNASSSGSQSRKKSKPDSKKNAKKGGETPINNLNAAPVNVATEHKPQKIFYNSKQNDDDALSICSEPGFTSGRRGLNQDVRGEKSLIGPGSYAHQNENSDDNNCSDTDEAPSCSERSLSGKRGTGRGHGGSIGNSRGRDFKINNDGGKVTAAKSCDQLNTSKHDENVAPETTEVVQRSNSVKDEAEPPVNNEPPNKETNPPTQAKKKNKKRKKKKNTNQAGGNEGDGDLMVFDGSGGDDDDEDEDNKEGTPSRGNGVYASDKIMEQFIGKKIPSLIEAIKNKIDVQLKVKDCIFIASKDGNVIKEKPITLLDIIQFNQKYPDGVCVKH